MPIAIKYENAPPSVKSVSGRRISVSICTFVLESKSHLKYENAPPSVKSVSALLQLRQYLYFCTIKIKASKLSTKRAGEVGACCLSDGPRVVHAFFLQNSSKISTHFTCFPSTKKNAGTGGVAMGREARSLRLLSKKRAVCAFVRTLIWRSQHRRSPMCVFCVMYSC